MSYLLNEHTHRFAVWTAARAVQRSFTSTENIKYAIGKSGLKEFVVSVPCKSQNDFDSFHESCCDSLIAALKEKEVTDASFGRAAKIVAIYLKTTIIIASDNIDERKELIHPPLDSILLSNLSAKEELKQLKNIRWTQIDKVRYKQIMDIIRNSPYPFNWKLEEYWEV